MRADVRGSSNKDDWRLIEGPYAVVGCVTWMPSDTMEWNLTSEQPFPSCLRMAPLIESGNAQFQSEPCTSNTIQGGVCEFTLGKIIALYLFAINRNSWILSVEDWTTTSGYQYTGQCGKETTMEGTCN